jgi:hypothetical protein
MRIAWRRMHAQRLVGPRFSNPAEAVGWFGAVQSQEYAPAKWALGQRTEGVSDDDVEDDFADGTILRTHVLRPTWHFVHPADIRWMLELTAPRVLAQSRYYLRQLELDDATLRKSNKVIERALRGENYLQRNELKPILEKAGVVAEGPRLAYIIMYAELDGLICSGPRKGKQHTYALLAERAPNAREIGHEQALAELTLRYFTSHGPATLKDFAWWSSLKMADIRKGLELVGSRLKEEEVDGITYWSGHASPNPEVVSPTVGLLQPYDEYVVAYKNSRHVFDASGTARAIYDPNSFDGPVMLDSQWVGRWKRTLKLHEVLVEASLYHPFDEAQTKALNTSVQEFGDFLGLRASTEISLIGPPD